MERDGDDTKELKKCDNSQEGVEIDPQSGESRYRH